MLLKLGKDYDFVLDQIGKNAALNLAMIDRDVTYGIFDLQGSAAAIKALRAACGSRANSAAAGAQAPGGRVYCGGGGAIKRQIEFHILDKPTDKWDARVTIDGKTIRAMTAYSYFGKSRPPRGFVAELGDETSLERSDCNTSRCG